MRGLYTVLLLVCSNVFMTLAWYGHLKLNQAGISSNWPLYVVILFSWAIAGIEYCFLVPQLKVIQEVVSLVIFCVIANILFQGQQLHWNHLAALICLVLAVYFVFK